MGFVPVAINILYLVLPAFAWVEIALSYIRKVCKEEKGGVLSRVSYEPTGLNLGQREEGIAMQEQTIEPAVESSPTWEHMEMILRIRMREWLQDRGRPKWRSCWNAANPSAERPWMAYRALAAATAHRGG